MGMRRRPRVARWLAVASVYATVGMTPLAQRGAIDGIVTDANLTPLPDASVSILGSNVRVTTGASGRFRIVQLAPGNYVVAVHRLGYAPVSAAMDIAADDTLRPSFALEPIASALDTMVISAKSLTGKLAEFDERRRLGFGHFLTQADIEKRNAVSITDLLRPIPSVTILRDSALSRRELPARTCGFVFYQDGVLLHESNLSRLPRPSEIAGIEVYSGPSTIPLQYKSANSTCGVILIWTKDGSS